MKKYYIDNMVEERKYGIYESLLENQNRIDYNSDEKNLFNEKHSKLKSLGAVNKDKYLLFVGDIDKLDHYALTNRLESEIGYYNYWFSFWHKSDKQQCLYIYHTTKGDEKNITEQLIELEYLMSVISECILYNNYNRETGWNVEVTIPSMFLENNKEETTFTNLGKCLSIIQNKYNELKDNYIEQNNSKKLIKH